MSSIMVCFLVSVAFGGVVAAIAWVWATSRLATMRERVAAKDAQLGLQATAMDRVKQEALIAQERDACEIVALKVKLMETETLLSERLHAADEKLRFATDNREELTKTFQNLATSALAESMERSQNSFASMAEDAFKKQTESASMDLGNKYEQIQKVMAPLSGAIAALKSGTESTSQILTHQLKQLVESQGTVTETVSALKSALQTPSIAGAFGEDCLKRLMTSISLVEGKHFLVKPSVTHPDTGADLSPDLLMLLSDGKSLPIDSKLPLKAYFANCAATTEKDRNAAMKSHVDALRGHIRELGNKEYDRAINGVGYSILFVSSESAFSAAIHYDPELAATAYIKHKIFLASPTTLMFILTWIDTMWRNDEAIVNIEAIQNSAIALNTALPDFLLEFGKVGAALKKTVSAYNDSLTQIESNVVPHAQEMASYGIPLRRDLKPVKQIRNKIFELSPAEG